MRDEADGSDEMKADGHAIAGLVICAIASCPHVAQRVMSHHVTLVGEAAGKPLDVQ